jgi:hypothetical protein
LPSTSSPTSSPSSKNTSNAKRNNETNAQIRHEAKSELAQHTSGHSRASGRTKKLDMEWLAGTTGPAPELEPGGRLESGETGLHAGQPVGAWRSRAMRRPGRCHARYRPRLRRRANPCIKFCKNFH